MLILSRRKTETIRLGDKISITILDIQRNQVKVGIEAPDYLEILREELYRKKNNILPIKNSMDYEQGGIIDV